MSDIREFLLAQWAAAERHATKDLHALDRATAGGEWVAWYGYNLPESVLKSDDVVVGTFAAHTPGLADGAEDQHAKDAFLVARMVGTARRRAEAVLADVAAKRQILDEHQRKPWVRDLGYCHCCSDKRGDDLEEWPCPTVRLLASPYRDMPGWQPEWEVTG